MLTKYGIYRMRGSHQKIELLGEHGNQAFVKFVTEKKFKWVDTSDVMMPLPEKNRWMRPWVDGDVMYSFFRWLFSDKVERKMMIALLVCLSIFVIIQIIRHVFGL